VIVLDSHVPARYVKNGYTVLSLDGRVLEVVPRALTPEEIRERDRKLMVQRAREKAARRQAEADERLLSKYSTLADVIRARDTKVSSIQSFIETSEGNLACLEDQRRSIQGPLVNVETAGGTIDSASLERLFTVENRISQILEEIEEKKSEMSERRLTRNCNGFANSTARPYRRHQSTIDSTPILENRRSGLTPFRCVSGIVTGCLGVADDEKRVYQVLPLLGPIGCGRSFEVTAHELNHLTFSS